MFINNETLKALVESDTHISIRKIIETSNKENVWVL